MDIEDINNAHELHCAILNSQVNLSPRNLFRDIRCGLKSNIPICCVLFFIVLGWFYFFINFSLVKRFIYWYPPQTTCEYCYKPCFICFLFHRVRKLYVCPKSDVNCCCFGKSAIVFLSEERSLNE